MTFGIAMPIVCTPCNLYTPIFFYIGPNLRSCELTFSFPENRFALEAKGQKDWMHQPVVSDFKRGEAMLTFSSCLDVIMKKVFIKVSAQYFYKKNDQWSLPKCVHPSFFAQGASLVDILRTGWLLISMYIGVRALIWYVFNCFLEVESNQPTLHLVASELCKAFDPQLSWFDFSCNPHSLGIPLFLQLQTYLVSYDSYILLMLITHAGICIYD